MAAQTWFVLAHLVTFPVAGGRCAIGPSNAVPPHLRDTAASSRIRANVGFAVMGPTLAVRSASQVLQATE